MTTRQSFTLARLAELIGGQLQGNPSCEINNVAPLQNAGQGDLSFLTHSRYQKFLKQTQASAVVLSPDQAHQCERNLILFKNPEIGIAKILAYMYKEQPRRPAVHPSAILIKGCKVSHEATIGPHVVIESGAIVGPGTVIESGSYIGRGAKIGKNCHLHPRVTIEHAVEVGDRAIIHSGVVLGADGFGFARDEHQKWIKIPQIGRVLIGNDVEIGANTTIDRGALEDTVIEDGVKMDNQIMVGHNVKIGEHTIIAGCVGIAGSAKIGRFCMIGGGSCINGHVEIADGVIITGMAMVLNSIKEAGVYSSGTGLQPNREWRKNAVRFSQLDQITKRLDELTKRLK